MNATVTELYKETGVLPSDDRVEVEALEWDADYYDHHYEINSKVTDQRGDKVRQSRRWLMEQDNIVVHGRASIQRLAMREFDRLMAQGQPDGENEPF